MAQCDRRTLVGDGSGGNQTLLGWPWHHAAAPHRIVGALRAGYHAARDRAPHRQVLRKHRVADAHIQTNHSERALVMKVNIQSLLGLWEAIHHGVREDHDERKREKTTATGAVEALKHPRGLARQQEHADR